MQRHSYHLYVLSDERYAIKPLNSVDSIVVYDIYYSRLVLELEKTQTILASDTPYCVRFRQGMYPPFKFLSMVGIYI